jgi:hypothetical protein
MKKDIKTIEPKKEIKSIWENPKDNSVETQQMINSKMKEKLQRQNQFRKTFFMRLYTEQEINEIKRQLTVGPIEMKWYNQPMPKEIVETELMLKYCIYQDYVAQENYLKQNLIRDGLTADEINDILNFKYKKTEQSVEVAEAKLDKLKQLEEEKVNIEEGVDKDVIE